MLLSEALIAVMVGRVWAFFRTCKRGIHPQAASVPHYLMEPTLTSLSQLPVPSGPGQKTNKVALFQMLLFGSHTPLIKLFSPSV